ncbi:hypothetical protein [Paraburkholderia graminis]|uniref:Uncharacterized protein n=1 Tax=Paraburkholderia graminis TaxID=60548 RepID=A0ABD5CS44_9BURK|nr:hypothetical protein [Paraburkholderia graminis]MDR6208060.1 hypothetical protein [Paraburkholderia graminis]
MKTPVIQTTFSPCGMNQAGAQAFYSAALPKQPGAGGLTPRTLLILVRREEENPLLAVLRNRAFWIRWGFSSLESASRTIGFIDALPRNERGIIETLNKLFLVGNVPGRKVVSLYKDVLFRHLLYDFSFNARSRLNLEWLNKFAMQKIYPVRADSAKRRNLCEALVSRGVIFHRTHEYKSRGLFSHYCALVYAAVDLIPPVLDGFLLRPQMFYDIWIEGARLSACEWLFGDCDTSEIVITKADCRVTGILPETLSPFVNGNKQGNVKTVRDCLEVMQGTAEGLLLLCTVYIRLQTASAGAQDRRVVVLPREDVPPDRPLADEAARPQRRRAARLRERACVLS